MARIVRTAPFHDRRDAGRKLAESDELAAYAGRDDAVVLALPRGGVPVGYEVAQALDLPLDVFVVRKLGVPGHEELAMGAIASGGILVLEEDVVRRLQLDEATIAAVRDGQTHVVASVECAIHALAPTCEPCGCNTIGHGVAADRRVFGSP